MQARGARIGPTYTAPMPRFPLAALMLCALGVAACAVEPPPPLRVLVKLAQPETDPAVIARMVERVGGTPVSYLAATSPHWHALALRCADAAACDEALRRLRADTATFAAVQRDERRRSPAP